MWILSSSRTRRIKQQTKYLPDILRHGTQVGERRAWVELTPYSSYQPHKPNRQVSRFWGLFEIRYLGFSALNTSMSPKEAILTDKAPAPLPFFSQAIKCNGMVYCSGSIGVDPNTGKLVDGSCGDRAVRTISRHHYVPPRLMTV